MNLNDLITIVREYARLERRTGQNMSEPIRFIVAAFQDQQSRANTADQDKETVRATVQSFLTNEYPAALDSPPFSTEELLS